MSALPFNSGHSSKRPSGLFLLKKLKILPMNQDHRSASSSRQRIDHPPPRRSDMTTRLVPVEVDLKQQIFDVCSSPNNGHSPKGRLRQLCANSGLKSDIVSRPFGARFGHLSITRILINSKSRCSRSRRPRQQSGLALAGNPDHANGLGTERREGVAQWRAGNLHQTRKWLTQLQD